jgi:hypothetical protein
LVSGKGRKWFKGWKYGLMPSHGSFNMKGYFLFSFSSQHPMLSSIDAFVAHGNSTHYSKYLKQQKENTLTTAEEQYNGSTLMFPVTSVVYNSVIFFYFIWRFW